MEWLWVLALVLGSIVSWMTNLVNLPGNWGILLLAAVYAWWGPQESVLEVGWGVVGGLAALALLGEVVEFVASAAGARQAGGSRRASLLAILGSVGGALLGAIVGVPIPVVGPIVAAVLFAALGAMAGATYGEWSHGKEWAEVMPVGKAAFWGRLWGTAGKLACGAVMVGVLIVALVL